MKIVESEETFTNQYVTSLSYLSWYDHIGIVARTYLFNFAEYAFTGMGVFFVATEIGFFFFKDSLDFNNAMVFFCGLLLSCFYSIVRCALSYTNSFPSQLEKEGVNSQKVYREKKIFWEYK